MNDVESAPFCTVAYTKCSLNWDHWKVIEFPKRGLGIWMCPWCAVFLHLCMHIVFVIRVVMILCLFCVTVCPPLPPLLSSLHCMCCQCNRFMDLWVWSWWHNVQAVLAMGTQFFTQCIWSFGSKFMIQMSWLKYLVDCVSIQLSMPQSFGFVVYRCSKYFPAH